MKCRVHFTVHQAAAAVVVAAVSVGEEDSVAAVLVVVVEAVGNFYVLSFCNTIKLSLRRTLVLLQRQ
jgi:hypothetical protein